MKAVDETSDDCLHMARDDLRLPFQTPKTVDEMLNLVRHGGLIIEALGGERDHDDA